MVSPFTFQLLLRPIKRKLYGFWLIDWKFKIIRDEWHVALDFNAQLADASDNVITEAMDINLVHEGETHRGRRARNGF